MEGKRGVFYQSKAISAQKNSPFGGTYPPNRGLNIIELLSQLISIYYFETNHWKVTILNTNLIIIFIHTVSEVLKEHCLQTILISFNHT